jgi:hypothetical protein
LWLDSNPGSHGAQNTLVQGGGPSCHVYEIMLEWLHVFVMEKDSGD